MIEITRHGLRNDMAKAGADLANKIWEGNAPFMASAGARAYMGVWGLCPQWGPGAKPLVRGSGGRSPPEAEAIFTIAGEVSA